MQAILNKARLFLIKFASFFLFLFEFLSVFFKHFFIITVNHYQIQIHWRSHDSSSRFGFKAKLFVTLHGDKGSTAEVALNE